MENINESDSENEENNELAKKLNIIYPQPTRSKLNNNFSDKLKKLSDIKFSMVSESLIQKLTVVNVNDPNIDPFNPSAAGIYDPKLGTFERAKLCVTCGLSLEECVGHQGHIRLNFPLIHQGHFRVIVNILSCICKTCSSLLIPQEKKVKYILRFSRKELNNRQRSRQLKMLVEECKKVKFCPKCHSIQGTVKRIMGQNLKICHVKWRNHKFESAESKRPIQALESYDQIELDEIKVKSSDAYEEMTPIRIFELLSKVSKEDQQAMKINTSLNEISSVVLRYIIVTPPIIRPARKLESCGKINEDDLSIRQTEIITRNCNLVEAQTEGKEIKDIYEQQICMQFSHAMSINGNVTGYPPQMEKSAHSRGIDQRLKGKTGRIRGNLSGKRVDFSGRTVISPDPNLSIEELGVPMHMAMIMTFPETVNAINFKKMMELVLAGPQSQPGANAIVVRESGSRFNLLSSNRKKIAQDLRIGDVVERHLNSSDIALFNRQPSLHRQSIMAHKVRVLPFRTLRFNSCVCKPQNADFDGDEMNIHIPQTYEAKAEAQSLASVSGSLISPKNGDPIIACMQDFLMACYQCSFKDMFLTKDQVMEQACWFSNADEKIELPVPCIIQPVELYSGKQLLSLLLKPSNSSSVLVNVCLTNKLQDKKLNLKWFDPLDGQLHIKNSEIISGRMCKASLGDGSKQGIIFSLVRDNSLKAGVWAMNRVARFASRFMGNVGFTIGIGDVTPTAEVIQAKADVLERQQNACNMFIAKFKENTLEVKAGCDMEQSLEAYLNKALSDVREEVGIAIKRTISQHNMPLQMNICGSKGSDINMSQMIGCVAQQTLNGQRIPDAFKSRTLPHFFKKSKTPEAKGFVENSFFSGLTSFEFFFHAMAGRVGLIDTAVKTADTGYMQRRLVKALEDLSVEYDGTVRNSKKEIVQFEYGEDGLEPMNMEGSNKPINFQRLWSQILDIVDVSKDKQITQAVLDRICLNSDQYLVHPKNIQKSNPKIETGKVYKAYSKFFLKDFREFIEKLDTKFYQIQIQIFLIQIAKKQNNAQVHPGECVGAVGATSIGEPATQMTLKTFHFAGVADMNITQGVPRLKEIINASKNISTPIIKCEITNKYDEYIRVKKALETNPENVSLLNKMDRLKKEIDVDNMDQKTIIKQKENLARYLKAKIEKTHLGDICLHIEEVQSPNDCFLRLTLDALTLRKLMLELTASDVADKICEDKNTKLKREHIQVDSTYILNIFAMAKDNKNMFMQLQNLKNILPTVVVSGITSISRVIITRDKKDETKLILGIEGQGLQKILGMDGVEPYTLQPNHIMEVERCLGIEAARASVLNETNSLLSGHGLTVDIRHVMLMADLMCHTGKVLGFTRYGILKSKNSTLQLASQEKTSEFLFEAAQTGTVEKLNGISESIITGQLVEFGTGKIDINQDFKTILNNSNADSKYIRFFKNKKSKTIIDQIQEDDA